MDRILYFAYGHNTNTEHVANRCHDAKVIGKATVQHHRLVMKKYLDIITDQTSSVTGLLWSMPVMDIDNLDYSEDYGKHYHHKIVQVDYAGERYMALTYTQIKGTWQSGKPDQKHYIDRVTKGYQENHLPMQQLKNAVSNTTNNT
jgi:Gamma-glutamyl cyclotransferase, AIG2-like